MKSVTKWAGRISSKIVERSALHDSPFIHQHDLVAEVGGFREIVSDQNGGLFQPGKNFLQIFLECGANERIECAERLVEQQKLGRKHERAHQADSLALAAGKFEGKPVERFFGKPGQRAELSQAGSPFSLAATSDGLAIKRTLRRAVRCGKSPPSWIT